MAATIQQMADLNTNIEFAKSLMAEFKQKNKDEGITASQAMWLHHRTRAWTFTYSNGVVYTVDIPNMVVSGDLETACLALIYGSADDMTESYHWMTSDRKDWLVTNIKAFLGWP
jgi:hypothetical protein